MLTVGQPVQWYVDTDHLQEVKINGQPAGLTSGNWDADSGQWTGDERRCDVSTQLASARRRLDSSGRIYPIDWLLTGSPPQTLMRRGCLFKALETLQGSKQKHDKLCLHSALPSTNK